MNQIIPQVSSQPATLPAATTLGTATLSVADLSRSLEFYERVVGLKPIEKNGIQAHIGAGNQTVLILNEKPHAIPQPTHTTGLYHVAILVPTRADLARVVANFATTQYPIQGYADHLVSEAFYLADPDGNGLEIYRDRPRDEWGWENGHIQMDSLPIDMDGLFAELPQPLPAWEGLPAGTKIGHMHLRVGNIPKALHFYHDILGFDIVAQMTGAAFISAGGYHHHIGMNVWQSRGASAPPSNSVGLEEFTVILPDAAEQEKVLARVVQSPTTYTQEGDALLIADPWNNRVRFIVG